MFVYLSKKIQMPNGARLRCISWSGEQNWIACGGEDGLLKVLKLEAQDGGPQAERGLAAPSNLSMNQTLDGHTGAVLCGTWNESFQKLTTSDESGLIIVWMLYKGNWYEEMINNRYKSVVRDMKWTCEGHKICIVYDDGAVIVGSVGGDRLWGSELKGVTLCAVEWSPDNRLILFGTGSGEVHVYDSSGNFCMRMAISCLQSYHGIVQLVGISWYNGLEGYLEIGCPCLVVAYSNGRMQLMRNEMDESPILVDTEMTIVRMAWNYNGSVLAVCGLQKHQDREVNIVQFYSPLGEHLRTLKVPGRQVNSLAWEGRGLRLALAVDSFIYFANIRPDYKWGFCSNTVVYAFSRADRAEYCVVFWDIKNNERHTKYVRQLHSIRAHKEYCVLTARNNDVDGQFVIVLCNSIGTPLEHKYIDIEPLYLCITETHIFAASKEAVYIWQFKSMRRLAALEMSLPGLSPWRGDAAGQERLIHADDVPSGAGQASMEFRKAHAPTRDPISAICATERMLVVGRESGILQRYALPRLALDMKHVLNCRPHHMALNCESSRLAIVDISGILHLFDFDKRDPNGSYGMLLNFERKDVWEICWAEDDPEMFAMMEKTRMYIIRGLDPEEPITTSGYICTFRNLEVKAVLLDDVMKNPETPTKDLIVDLEIKSLRDSRDLLEKIGLTEANNFIETNSHPRLWQLLAHSAIENREFEMAEKAFVRCQDYYGIQFVKRLQRLDSEVKQTAEVNAFFKRFEATERQYLSTDRRDLAVGLRMKLGDWFRVVQLLKAGRGGGDDKLLRQAWNAIGDYYAERQKWKSAATYYSQAQNMARLAHCFDMLEDFESLQELAINVREGDPLLVDLGRRFSTVGMCEQAVAVYLKAGQVKAAVDTCVHLNEWDQAVMLAKNHNLPEISTLLAQYASHLLETDKRLEAIELYRKANHYIEAAKLLFQLADEVTRARAHPLRAKKLYVMAAMMVESYRAERNGHSSEGSTSAYISDDLSHPEVMAMLDNAWRGAEALHLFLMAQRHVHEYDVKSALRLSIQLVEYEDILPPEDVYSLLALASALSKAFEYSSKAFARLETIDTIKPERRQALEELAVKIFSKHRPQGGSFGNVTCTGCGDMMPDWQSCCPSCDTKYPLSVTTGQPLIGHRLWTCSFCRHQSDTSDMATLSNCPLCHTSL